MKLIFGPLRPKQVLILVALLAAISGATFLSKTQRTESTPRSTSKSPSPSPAPTAQRVLHEFNSLSSDREVIALSESATFWGRTCARTDVRFDLLPEVRPGKQYTLDLVTSDADGQFEKAIHLPGDLGSRVAGYFDVLLPGRYLLVATPVTACKGTQPRPLALTLADDSLASNVGGQIAHAFKVVPALDGLARPKRDIRMPRPSTSHLSHGGLTWAVYFAVLEGPELHTHYADYIYGVSLIQEANWHLESNFRQKYRFLHGGCDQGAAEALKTAGSQRAVHYTALYFRYEWSARQFAKSLNPPALAVARVRTYCMD